MYLWKHKQGQKLTHRVYEALWDLRPQLLLNHHLPHLFERGVLWNHVIKWGAVLWWGGCRRGDVQEEEERWKGVGVVWGGGGRGCMCMCGCAVCVSGKRRGALKIPVWNTAQSDYTHNIVISAELHPMCIAQVWVWLYLRAVMPYYAYQSKTEYNTRQAKCVFQRAPACFLVTRVQVVFVPA